MRTEYVIVIVLLLLFAGCGPAAKPGGVTGTVQVSPIDALAKSGVTFAGGDGGSVKKAVVIRARRKMDGIRAEYIWVRQEHPDWELKQQQTVSIQGRKYDIMAFTTLTGDNRTLYFDITEFITKP